MADTSLKFLVYYTTFMFFVIYMSTWAGLTIFRGAENIESIIPTNPTDLINPFWFYNAVWTLFGLSSEFALLTIVVLTPFFVGLTYIIISLVRGVSS